MSEVDMLFSGRGWLPTFDSGFWQSFWPEAAAGLLTGLVVGLVLFAGQGRSDRRADIRQSKLAWASVRGIVERAIVRNGAFSAVDITVMGFGRAEIDQLLSGRPLEKWIDDLQTRDLIALRDFLRLGTEVEYSGLDFILRCNPPVVAATKSKKKRREILKRIRLKAHHSRFEVIDAFLGPQSSEIVEIADRIFMQDDVRAAHRRHHKAHEALRQSRSELIAALGLIEPPVIPFTLEADAPRGGRQTGDDKKAHRDPSGSAK